MLNRNTFLAVAFALFFSGAAQADSYDDDSSDSDSDSKSYSEYRAYRACLKTKPVRFHGTIVGAALATPELSILTQAVVDAGLAGVLSGPGPFTVFAPTNTAFGNVPPELLGPIVDDPAGLLPAVLTYHVISGKGKRNDPRRTIRGWAIERPTVNGQTIFFNRSKDGPQVNQSNVDCQAVKTDNGMVYFIDSVLLPQF